MAKNGTISGADPAFEKGEGAEGSGHAPGIFFANLGAFLKKLAQKGVGVRPLRPLSVSAPAYQYYSLCTHFREMNEMTLPSTHRACKIIILHCAESYLLLYRHHLALKGRVYFGK